MAKGLSSVVVLVIVLAVASAGLLVANSQYNIFSGGTGTQAESSGETEITSEETSADDLIFDGLKSQLTSALQTGGISPESYSEISAAIEGLGGRGYSAAKIDELRSLLSRLDVGGESSQTPAEEASEEASPGVVTWHYRDNGWEPEGTPPACPDPLALRAPVDLGRVTAMMYPGQVRGGDFKPHGGFHADMSEGPVEVTAPLEGYVWRVAKFTDEFGIHYMIDIQHECGIMYRLGHLGAVPPKMEAVFDSVGAGAYGDSRTYTVEPVRVELGETIATNIQDGPGFDWGVYDLRNENDASKDPAFRDAYEESDREQAFNAICWLDYLPAEDGALLRGLPTGVEGKTSAYC